MTQVNDRAKHPQSFKTSTTGHNFTSNSRTSLDSRVAHGANDVRLSHPFHHRRNVLLLKLQVLFDHAHFWRETKTQS